MGGGLASMAISLRIYLLLILWILLRRNIPMLGSFSVYINPKKNSHEECFSFVVCAACAVCL